jgi:hypothetical protein
MIMQMQLMVKMMMGQLVAIKLQMTRTGLKRARPIGVEGMTGEAEIETENEI